MTGRPVIDDNKEWLPRCLTRECYRKLTTLDRAADSAISGSSPWSGGGYSEAAWTSLLAMTPRQRCSLRCNVRRFALPNRFGDLPEAGPAARSHWRPGLPVATPTRRTTRPRKDPSTFASGAVVSSWALDRLVPASHAVDRAAWRATAPGSHRAGWARSPGTRSVNADWASRMVCSNATESNVALCSTSAAFDATLTVSCRITCSEDVAGGLCV